MSKIEANTIDSVSGTSTLTLGSSNASTIALGSGDVQSNFMYPAFQARLSANQSLSDDTFVKLQFNTEEYDTNSAYDNSSNYRFTVPSNLAGKYLIYVAVTIDSETNSNLDSANVTIYRNGSAHPNGGLEYYMLSNPPRFVPITHSLVIELSATDYVEVYARIEASDASGGRATQNSTFGAYRIGT